jgi:hypothetical protein
MNEEPQKHFPRGGHPILADSVAVRLKRQFDIAVSKQSLHRLWIGADATGNRRRRLRRREEDGSDDVAIVGLNLLFQAQTNTSRPDFIHTRSISHIAQFTRESSRCVGVK